jgi:hypothetical protein
MNAEIIFSIIGVIGTIASIYGAIISVKEAKKSKASAETAIEIKKQLMTRKTIVELAELKPFASNAIICSRRLTAPGGVDLSADIDTIKEFISKLYENKSHFKENEKTVESLYRDVIALSHKFPSMTAQDKKKMSEKMDEANWLLKRTMDIGFQSN